MNPDCKNTGKASDAGHFKAIRSGLLQVTAGGRFSRKLLILLRWTRGNRWVGMPGEVGMMPVRILFAMTLAVLPAPAGMVSEAQAQSFNCRYARTADEVLICQDGELSTLDQRMSGSYFRLRNSLGGRRRAALESDQAVWLRSRMDCGRDRGCIAESYRERIRELRNY